jgi:hypothetical protein
VLALLALAAVLIGLLFSRLFPVSRQADAPLVRFSDTTRQSGIDFVHDNGERDGQDTPTTLPGAVAFIDYDGDGLPDLFFVGGTSWPWSSPRRYAFGAGGLYHNDGKGHFSNATKGSGLEVPMLGMGVAVGDYANEGRPDIFVTGVGGNRLFHNLGGGKFADVTEEAGVGGDDHIWSTGAVWIDITGSGRLDLVVCNYARWSHGTDLRQAFVAEVAGPSYAAPAGFVSAFPTVYRNLGGGKFVDVSAKTGLNLIDRQTGFPRAAPLAVAAVDANGDGKLDLLFTYQAGPNVLFLNQGDGTFREWTPPAEERREGSSAGLLGAGVLPYSRLGQASDRFGILRAAGLALGASADETEEVCSLSNHLGIALLDYDLDGRIDIVTGNGLAEPKLEHFEHGRDFGSEPALLWNNGRGWAAAPLSSGNSEPSPRLVARGVAVGSINGNGTLDIVVAQNGGAPRLFSGDPRVRNAWLRVDLVGTHCARDAGGARVEVHTPRGVLVQTMEPAMGFMAQSEKTLTFGLGADDRVRKIVVRWPGGALQEVRPGGVNRLITITEPN